MAIAGTKQWSSTPAAAALSAALLVVLAVALTARPTTAGVVLGTAATEIQQALAPAGCVVPADCTAFLPLVSHLENPPSECELSSKVEACCRSMLSRMGHECFCPLLKLLDDTIFSLIPESSFSRAPCLDFKESVEPCGSEPYSSSSSGQTGKLP